MKPRYHRIGRAGAKDNGCAPHWTAAEVEHLRMLRVAGLSYKEIAAELGRTRSGYKQIYRSARQD